MITREHIHRIAEVCYNVNSAYSVAVGETETLKTWINAEQWERDTILSGIDRVIEYPDKTPEEFHKDWVKEKESSGWKFGHEKSSERKLHPDMVPYQYLPLTARVKDFILLELIKTRLEQVQSEAIVNPFAGPQGPPSPPGPSERSASDESKVNIDWTWNPKEIEVLSEVFINAFNEIFNKKGR